MRAIIGIVIVVIGCCVVLAGMSEGGRSKNQTKPIHRSVPAPAALVLR